MLPRAFLLALIAALVPLPVAAGDRTQTHAPTIKASMARLVARDLAGAPAASSQTRAARQTPPAGGAPGFFKSGPGIVALAVLAAGTGYALYSAKHDRIHSAGKQ
jgi:protein-disulfide isomerase